VNGDEIPPDVRQFVLDHIDSVAQLEALLLLRQSPEETWSVNQAAQRLYIDRGAAEQILAALQVLGLVAHDGGSPPTYRYEPRSPARGDGVGRLAEIYRQRLIAVTNLIHSKPVSNIRRFADAFRMRKDG
jgi:hypothetical protein